jgi:hypothetical protein
MEREEKEIFPALVLLCWLCPLELGDVVVSLCSVF